MRIVFVMVLYIVNGFCYAQQSKASGNYVVIGRIEQKVKNKEADSLERPYIMPRRPVNGPIVDLVRLDTVGNKELSAKVYKLLDGIKKNGDGDVSKCFIPRHAILVYKQDSLYAKLVICFECEGFRYTIFNEKEANTVFTDVKSYKVRLKQLDMVSAIFAVGYKQKEIKLENK
jgi:hypothetical protein